MRISDSTPNARRSANARRATAELDEVEVDRDLAAAAQVHAARDVEEPRELGEPVAVRVGRDRRELVAEVLREDTLERQQPALVREAERAVRAEAAGGDDAVAGHERAPSRFRAQNVPAARAAPGAPASAASSP